MKKLTLLVTGLSFAFLFTIAAIAQSATRITENSAGKIRLGMTVSEARKALPSMAFERRPDVKGTPLIGVGEKDRDELLFLFTGETGHSGKIDDDAKITGIIVANRGLKTANGVEAFMMLRDVAKLYGGLKEVALSEIDGREYASFVNHPKGLRFRVTCEHSRVGDYFPGQRTATGVQPCAQLHSIVVDGRSGPDAKQGTILLPESFQPIDHSAFNRDVSAAHNKGEEWTRSPSQLAARFLPPLTESGSRVIEFQSLNAETLNHIQVVAVDDGFADDSVKGAKYVFSLYRSDNGLWHVTSAKKAVRCWPGRGHEGFSHLPCK